jgi:hypothetical protein
MCALGASCSIGGTSLSYWSNHNAAGSTMNMSPTSANKITCYGVELPYAIPLKTVILQSASASDTNLYGVAIFPQSSTPVGAVFSSTAINWPASGSNASFQQSGAAVATLSPGLYAVCTTGNNATTTGTIKGSANSGWYWVQNPGGLSSASGLISGTLATNNGTPSMSNNIPNIQFSAN